MKEIIEKIQNFDTDKVLLPFLEANAVEFESNPGLIPREEDILEWSRFAGIDSSAEKELMSFAHNVLSDKLSSFLYFHCSKLAFDLSRLYSYSDIYKWPSFDAFFPEKSNLFLLLVAVSMVPKLCRIHRALKVPLEISRDTCGDIASRIEISREFRNGKIGISLTCLVWLRNHANGSLFQFGRLQFHPIILDEPVFVFRRKSNGEVIVFCEPGQRFIAEGYYDGAGNKIRKDAWFSTWEEKDGKLRANRFAKNGLAQREPTTINLDEWTLVADSSSAVMNTHIPRGKRITMEDWRESIQRGFDFFRTTRAVSAKTVACACKSWMFDPRLQELLPENSGLVSLQKKVNLFPLCSSSETCGCYFIFGKDKIDMETAPADTSLRRAVIKHLKNGGFLSGGAMLIFEDQLDALL